MAISYRNHKKRNLRFRISFVWALVTALIVFMSGYAIHLIVKVKRINDLATHSMRISTQVSNLSAIRTYLLEKPDAPDKEEAERLLKILLIGDPFIEKMVLIDQFGKIPFTIMLSDNEMMFHHDNHLASLPLQDLLSASKPSLSEKEWEYLIPLSLESDIPWGMMKLYWRADATWKFFHFMKLGIAYITLISFFIAYILSYFLIGRTYVKEYQRLNKTLSMICGSDYSQRIETQTYSKGISEIGVHMNRIIHEIDEEKKKADILDNSLRHIERGASDYRRACNDKTTELESMRREMREGLLQLFDLLWCGIMVIDDSYNIHFINQQAERLLRFARIDDSVLNDERVKGCLASLVNNSEVDVVDDLCVWPQPSLGQSVSCQLRASKIPTGANERLFFVLLREECGYPKKHNSAYYSERLVLDFLVHDQSIDNPQTDCMGFENADFNVKEDRFRACLRKLETFHALEQGTMGSVSSIRLSTWLRHHFTDEDLYSNGLKLDANMPDMDITLKMPERMLREFIDSLLVIVSRMININSTTKASNFMVLRTSIDSRGKPMITLSLPRLRKMQANLLHDVLNERLSLQAIANNSESSMLEDLELDICYSLFRSVKQLLHAFIVCVYSENKKLAMVQLTIENHILTNKQNKSAEVEAEAEESLQPRLVQQFLSRY